MPHGRFSRGRRGSPPGDLPLGVPEARELQRRLVARHLALSAGAQPLPRLREEPAGEDAEDHRFARRADGGGTGGTPRHADCAAGSGPGARAAAGRLPRGVRAARRRGARSQGSRRAPWHCGRHVEVAGVQGAAQAARAAEVNVMHPEERLIHEFVEGTLDAGERAGVERHLAECAACRELADDLAEIRRVAASLEPRLPPARAWLRLERALQLEAGAGGGTASTSPLRSSWIWLAAAAVLVLATVVGLRFTPGVGRTAPQTTASVEAGATASDNASAEAVEAELRAAESHYDRAIKGLEQIASAEKGALDPKTAATLQKNLAVIDQAITESRAAVREQPTSEPAVSSLMENFKTKLALLQDTVALINEMRKGNEAGTAQAAPSLRGKSN